MSVLIATAVLDLKVGAYSPPMFTRSKGEAVRSFLDACADSNTSLHRHPEDYQLIFIGTFDDQTGLFVSTPVELLVAGGQ